MSRIDEIAAYVIDQLRGEVIIHRYDAYTTNSIYLKFDYGAANSLRISDHRGKKHLAYRFNINVDIDKPFSQKNRSYLQEFFPPTMVNNVIKKILENKAERQKRYKDYDEVVESCKEKAMHERGFWTQAREVK